MRSQSLSHDVRPAKGLLCITPAQEWETPTPCVRVDYPFYLLFDV